MHDYVILTHWVLGDFEKSCNFQTYLTTWYSEFVNADDIGSGNGVVSLGQQPIIWANVDSDLCFRTASLGHNELT